MYSLASCGNDKTVIYKNEKVGGKLCLLNNLSGLYELIGFKENAVIAVTSSSIPASRTFKTNLRAYVRETEAIIYEINISDYLNFDSTYDLPVLYDSKCPALLVLSRGEVVLCKTYSSNKSLFTNKDTLFNYLNKNVRISPFYNLADVNDGYLSDQGNYMFYVNYDARLLKYLNGNEAIPGPFAVVFYDSTIESDIKFINTKLKSITSIFNKTYLINVVKEKYNYDSFSHTLNENANYNTFSLVHTFGKYQEVSTKIVTPAINVYNDYILKLCTILSNHNDDYSDYYVRNSSDKIKELINSINY